MPNGIEKQTFQEYPVKSKLDTLFDYVVDIREHQQEQLKLCDTRFKKVEKRGIVDKGLAIIFGAVFGFFGGLFKA